jgi:hypothetical protein
MTFAAVCTAPRAEATDDMSKIADVASHVGRTDQVDESQHMVQSRMSFGLHLGVSFVFSHPHTAIWGPSNDLLGRHIWKKEERCFRRVECL